MIQPPKNAPFSARGGLSWAAQKRKSEINLSGAGKNWDVLFASKEDLSEAITFRREVDVTGFAGTSRHTLSIFTLDGSIKFRDTRSHPVRRADRSGTMRNVDLTAGAFLEIKPQEAEVVRHEENGDDWIVLIKLRPGRAFKIIYSPIIPPAPPTSLPISHNMLRLWTMRSEIQRMQYLGIVIHNHRTYMPWAVVLQKEALGSIRTSSASTPVALAAASTTIQRSTTLKASSAYDDDLIDLQSEGPPPARSTAEASRSSAETETRTDLPSEEPEAPPLGETELPPSQEPEPPSEEPKDPAEPMSSDPFESIWNHALTLANSGKEEEKGSEWKGKSRA